VGESATGRYRLLVLASHVIQYQVPMFRTLAADPRLDLTVSFCSDWGLTAYRDEGFGREVRWDVPLLDGFRSEFLPNWSPRPHPSRFWGLFNPAALQHIRCGEFDAVWVHGWASVTNCTAMLAAFLAGVPVLLRGETNLLSPLPRWKRWLKHAILSRLFRNVSAFLAIGQNNADFYRAYGVPAERILAVPYAVDNDFFTAAAHALPPKNDLKRDLQLPRELPVILFCGKLTPVKRPMDLLRAFEKLSRTRPAALLFVGDGVLRRDLENYSAEHQISNVHFVGFRNQTELPRYFGVGDVFVLPSSMEPWGLVVNEAMNFGLPVICSDQVGCVADLVKPGENGYVFPAGDIDALADSLVAMLADEGRRSAMGERSRALISDWAFRNDLEGVVAALQRVIRPALS
jgi:glycosyltransferase involved in cell wall biosynthesis